jgi:hypothetical protein
MKRKGRLLNAINARLANLERKTHEQFKHRNAEVDAELGGGKEGGSTGKEDEEEELD